jgi:hypothetical protein
MVNPLIFDDLSPIPNPQVSFLPSVPANQGGFLEPSLPVFFTTNKIVLLTIILKSNKGLNTSMTPTVNPG